MAWLLPPLCETGAFTRGFFENGHNGHNGHNGYNGDIGDIGDNGDIGNNEDDG